MTETVKKSAITTQGTTEVELSVGREDGAPDEQQVIECRLNGVEIGPQHCEDLLKDPAVSWTVTG